MKYNLAGPHTDFLNALNSVGCSAFIDKPTRVKSGTASCIDHVHSNFDTSSLQNHIILADVSDHFGTLSKIEGITRENEKQTAYYRVLPYFMLVPLRNVGFFNIQKDQFFVLENEIFSKNIVV